MFILYLVILLILLLFSFLLFHEKIMSPAVLVLLMFFLCSLISLLRWNDWNIEEYSLNTVLCILTGILSFTLASVFASRVFFPHGVISRKPVSHQHLDLGYIYSFGALFIGIFTSLLFFLKIRNLVVTKGYASGKFSQLLLSYYQIKRYHKEWIKFGSLIKLLSFLSKANAAISLYVFVHNVVFKVFRKSDLFHLLIVGAYFIYALLDSSRGEMLIFMAEMIYLIYFFLNIKAGWRSSVNKRIIRIAIPALLIILSVFLVLTVVMGRRDSYSSINVMDYLTIYAGSAIRNFDLYMQNPVRSDFPGKETFYSIVAFLNNRFGIGSVPDAYLEYRAIKGKNIGNIYTAFRRYYADFGMAGVIVLSGILGLFYSGIFYKIIKMKDGSKSQLYILLFSYLSAGIFFMPIEDRFFIMDFSVNGMIKIILIIVIYIVFIGKAHDHHQKRRKTIRIRF